MPYKINSVTGETSEYVFDIGGILALRNFTARTNEERLIIQSATNANFTILDALVSEVEIDGVVYDNPTSAQEALQRLVFNPAVPVIMTLAQQQLLEGALQKGTYSGTAQDLKQAIDNILTILNSPDTTLDDLNEIVAFIKQNKQVLDTLAISNIAGLQEALNEKANTNHTHAFSDLTGTENVASKQDITEAEQRQITNATQKLQEAKTYAEQQVNKLQIGGRNLILKSKEKRTLNGYMGLYWDLSAPLEVGKEYVFSCQVQGNTPLWCYFTDIVGQQRQTIKWLSNGYNQAVISPHYNWTGICIYQEVGIGGTGTAHVENINFEKGNKTTDWSPAPEDIEIQINTTILKTSANVSTSQFIGGFSQNGRTIVTQGTANIVITADSADGFVACYQKAGTGNITFQAGSGKNLVQVDRTNVVDGAKGSTATITIVGNEVLLRISNV